MRVNRPGVVHRFAVRPLTAGAFRGGSRAWLARRGGSKGWRTVQRPRGDRLKCGIELRSGHARFLQTRCAPGRLPDLYAVLSKTSHASSHLTEAGLSSCRSVSATARLAMTCRRMHVDIGHEQAVRISSRGLQMLPAVRTHVRAGVLPAGPSTRFVQRRQNQPSAVWLALRLRADAREETGWSLPATLPIRFGFARIPFDWRVRGSRHV